MLPNGAAKIDDNDRLRNGVLPVDPFADARRVAPPRRGKAEDTPVTPPSALPRIESMGELGPWLTEQPPPRRWLLRTREGSDGVLPLGIVGMVAGQGAIGKSWVLIQLALSVATGRPWLDTFSVNEPGNVLLALGEEPEDEVRWRLFYAAQEMGLTDEEKVLAGERLFPLALAGRQVALTLAAEGMADQTGATLPETGVAKAFRKQLEGREWKLIVVDPLSRFAGPDVEIDNSQATRFVQVLETLVAAPGEPAVLFAHHTNKTARRDSALGSDATAARGSSALSDAARFQANLVPEKKLPEDAYPASEPRLLTLSFPKTTRSAYLPDLRLARGRYGVLRPATNVEMVAFDNAASNKATVSCRSPKPSREEKVAALRDRILDELAIKPGSGANLQARLKTNRQHVLDACRELEVEGLIQRASPTSPWTLVEPVPWVLELVAGTPLPDDQTGSGSRPPLIGAGTPERVYQTSTGQCGGEE